MSAVRFRDVASESDLDRYATVEATSFGESRDVMAAAARASLGRALVRMGMAGDEVVAGYSLIPVGQFFGAASVPGQAVASVFVHPAWRRRGIAGVLLRDLVDACRGMRTALAPLYASTTRLYRRFGWEVGERSLRGIIRADALARLKGEGQARLRPSRRQVEAMRRAWLCRFDGPLDRPDWWLEIQWDSEEKPDERHEYGWFESDRLTGHMTYRQVRGEHDEPLAVFELVATTPDAVRGMYGLLGAHESMLSRVSIWNAAHHLHQLSYLLPDIDKVVKVEGSLCWMQRIVDVGRALETRGWAGGVDARIELEVSDPCCDEPARMVLEVADGAARIEPGGRGGVRCGVGALSAWYSARLSAFEARQLSLLEAPSSDVELMDSLIPARPRMEPDHF
jgi:predicted acetyltransferase